MIRLPLIIWLLLTGFTVIHAQSPTTPVKGTAVITGRITIDNQPQPGVEVILNATSDLFRPYPDQNSPTKTSATTDAEGNYKLTGIAAGNYLVTAFAPAHVPKQASFNPYPFGREINVSDGETIEKIDFNLIRGGVITGKVTEPDGKPLIEERVLAFPIDDSGKRLVNNDVKYAEADDRGIYRFYGLVPGRYKVSAGSTPDDLDARRMGGSAGFLRQTFYRDATNEAEAAAIEVKPGSEIENIDIRLSPGGKGYAASGRITDAETGKPIAGIMIGYGIRKSGRIGGSQFSNSSTNSNGEFRIEGLTQNTYAIFPFGRPDNEFYGEPVDVEIANADVAGLEIRMLRGAMISGSAVIEGTKDPSILSSMRRISIYFSPMDGAGLPISAVNALSPDGTFKINGVRPGKMQIGADTYQAPKGLSHVRTELNGAPVSEIVVNPGDRITGIKLFLTYGTGSIAGRVEIRGGSLPQGSRLYLQIKRDNQSGQILRGSAVDDRGQFIIEGLADGDYLLFLTAYGPAHESTPKIPKVEQAVTIANNSRETVSLVLDLSKKEE